MSLNIASHISFLLHEHDCVILADFGGFVANYGSAKIDPVIQLMHPPTKHIVFNRSLQNNDGLLVNEVASCEGISFKKAQKEVGLYVSDLKDRLHLHKKVIIEGVGTLIQSHDNTLLFVQDLTTNHLLSSYAMGTIQSPVIKRISVQERIGAKIKQLDDNHLPSNKKSWLKVAAVLLPLAMVSVAGLTQKGEIESAVANLNPFSTLSAGSKMPALESAKIFNYSTHSPTNNIVDAVQQSFVIKAEAEATIQTQTPKHFIIAGAFGSKHNAKKLVRKLQRWNYSNARIMGQSKKGLYRVCYDGFAQTRDATIALQQIKQENQSAWMLSL